MCCTQRDFNVFGCTRLHKRIDTLSYLIEHQPTLSQEWGLLRYTQPPQVQNPKILSFIIKQSIVILLLVNCRGNANQVIEMCMCHFGYDSLFYTVQLIEQYQPLVVKAGSKMLRKIWMVNLVMINSSRNSKTNPKPFNDNLACLEALIYLISQLNNCQPLSLTCEMPY